MNSDGEKDYMLMMRSVVRLSDKWWLHWKEKYIGIAILLSCRNTMKMLKYFLCYYRSLSFAILCVLCYKFARVRE